jgi:hypothetical protein
VHDELRWLFPPEQFWSLPNVGSKVNRHAEQRRSAVPAVTAMILRIVVDPPPPIGARH